MVVTSIALQSFQTFIGEQSEKNGGNTMGLGANDSPRWVSEFTTLWTNKADDDLINTLQIDAVNTAEATSKVVTAKGATSHTLPTTLAKDKQSCSHSKSMKHSNSSKRKSIQVDCSREQVDSSTDLYDLA